VGANLTEFSKSIMKLTKEQVRHLAKLARLHLTEEEIERFANQLTDVLEYVEMLKDLDLDGVPECSQVTGLVNVSREDVVDGKVADVDDLLACSPLPKQDHQIRIKRIV
jgi:aspartyl-tRNA(Asn)/glutamyl-tRNA(Gln) amidotransferase subunit C